MTSDNDIVFKLLEEYKQLHKNSKKVRYVWDNGAYSDCYEDDLERREYLENRGAKLKVTD